MRTVFFKFLFLFLVISTPSFATMEDGIRAVQEGRNAEALVEFHKYSRLGSPLADYWIATMYLQGRGVEKDIQTAIKWLHRATKQDYIPAMLVLANLYLDGKAGENKSKLALGWLKKAAEKDDAFALFRLGEVYLEGKHFPKNERAAFLYFQRAALLNYPKAQYILGLAYLNGIGVSSDPQKGISWIEKAADAGDNQAREDLEALSNTQ